MELSRSAVGEKNRPAYAEALGKAATYSKQLGLTEIGLVFFLDAIDDENRKKLEADYNDEEIGMTVLPIFVETGAKMNRSFLVRRTRSKASKTNRTEIGFDVFKESPGIPDSH